MKKFIIPILIVVMVVSIIFAGCFGPSAPPQPGEWYCTKLDGFEEVTSGVVLVAFLVNPTSTGITAVGCVFQDFTCGGIQWEGGHTVETAYPWPITRGRFTIERVTIVDTTRGPLDLTVQGKFDETGTQASGTWEVSSAGKVHTLSPLPSPPSSEGTVCQEGTWEASAP